MTPNSEPSVIARSMAAVAHDLLGEPNDALSTKDELRFGTHGSMAIDLPKGTFYDHEAGQGGGVLDLVMRERSVDKQGALAWLQEHRHIPPLASLNIIARYPYTDVNGRLIFEVVRLDPKDFRQRRPDGAGGWIWKMAGVQRVLYRLPAVVATVSAGEPVFIVEGEKAADRLAGLGVAATCSPGGANKWRKEYSTPLAGADVVVLPDNDVVGREHAAAVAKALRHGLISRAARVRVLELPGLPDKGDVADWIAAGGTLDQLVQLAEAAPDWVPPQPKESSRKAAADLGHGRPHLPTIRVVAGMLDIMTTEAEDALLAAGKPIYQRGRDLMRPISVEVAASDGRKVKAAGLVDMNPHSIVDTLCSVSEWEKFDGRSEEWVRTNPPKQVAEILLSRQGQWRVPVIAGVITTPTMRPDGSLVTAHGFDPVTRLYHMADPSLKLHGAVQNPTRETAVGALAALKQLLEEFPFVERTVDGQVRRTSLAVAIAGMVTPVVRGALPVAPLTVYRANTAGSGKSFLADVVSVIASGRECPVVAVAAGDDDVETEKRLTGLLLAGFPIISLDNVNGELGGDLLCQAVERPLVRLRRLGGSDIIEVESVATIYATGNNLRVRGDMVRRTLVADLDPGMERPELREFRNNPVATVLADRGRYVSACLIIVRAYLLAGQPGKLKPIASFGAWSDMVRSALVWLGCDDPAESMEAAREDDPELGALREVMIAWDDVVANQQTTTAKLINIASEQMAEADDCGDRPMHGGKMVPRHPELTQALVSVAGGRTGIDALRLGKWLGKNAGRVVGLTDRGARRFKKQGKSMGAPQWKLERQHQGRWM